MSGPYCETCDYFHISPLSDDWGECTDPTKRIFARCGDVYNDAPSTMRHFECSNHTGLNEKAPSEDEA